MKRDLIFEATYPHAAERIWRALTDSAAMAEWLMPNDFQARLGHKFQFRTKPAPGFDGIVNCEVREIDPPRRLAFTWKGGPVDTVVVFTLVSTSPTETRLRLEQRGFQGPKACMVSFLLGKGWKRIFRKLLPEVLARISDQGLLPRGEGDPRSCHYPEENKPQLNP
jgi:uncharacterized protein YndB with AHSA1/START domain